MLIAQLVTCVRQWITIIDFKLRDFKLIAIKEGTNMVAINILILKERGKTYDNSNIRVSGRV